MLENTESQEMYLTTIYALQKKNGMVRSVDVADERGYSKVSVHNAMKRLEEFGYVTFHQGKITLTKCGIEKVKNIEQKHQTIASALKLIGASNDIAEENACRMEHVITDEAADLLKLYVEQRFLKTVLCSPRAADLLKLYVEQRTAEQENTIAIKV